MGLCSALPLLICTLWIGTAMYVAGGIFGLSSTLNLFEKYGPVNGSGNPALDPPPQLRWDPIQGKYVPVNPNYPGNRVPKAFSICIGILGAWAVIIFVSSLAFINDSRRCNAAIKNRSYVGNRTSDSAISCTSFLTGYCVFLVVVWFVQAGFAVLPVLEYRITMQRCWDLNNPEFAETTKRTVCLDLVQYGLVLFRETSNSGFGLICGPGGSYNPPRGDLVMFCEKYIPSFAAFVICFAGAGISTLVLVLLAIHHSSNFVYLKIRRYEGLYADHYAMTGYRHPTYKTEVLGRPPSTNDMDQHMHTKAANGVHPSNRSYGPSVAEMRHPKKTPAPEVMAFKRYGEDEEIDGHALSTTKYRGISSDNESFDGDPPAYKRSNGGPSYAGDSGENTSAKRSRSRKAQRKRRRDKDAHAYSSRGSRLSGSDREWRAGRPSDEDVSGRYSSEEEKVRKSRARQEHSYQDESPDSDYYMNEDRQRYSSKRWK